MAGSVGTPPASWARAADLAGAQRLTSPLTNFALDSSAARAPIADGGVPPALRRALQHRDRGCRFPGCTVRVGQGHHIRHWAQGGPTTLSNLVLLCRRHHRAVHEEGYRIEREPSGELQFRHPNGWPLPEVADPVEVPDDALETLLTRHEAEGLHVHPQTGCAGWLGEPLDVGWAIDVLHPLATGERHRVRARESAGLSSLPRDCDTWLEPPPDEATSETADKLDRQPRHA